MVLTQTTFNESLNLTDKILKITFGGSGLIKTTVKDTVALTNAITKITVGGSGLVKMTVKDTIALLDSTSKQLGKSESVQFSDSVSMTIQRAITVTDVINEIDTSAKQISKNPAIDKVTFTDVNNNQVTKNVSDIVPLSDTEKSADVISKAFLESTSFLDTVTATTSRNRTLSDILNESDSASKQIVKTFSDTMKLGDSEDNQIGKMMIEDPILNDSMNKAISKSLNDSIPMSDAAGQGVSKTISDSLIQSDNITIQKNITIAILETLTLNDTVAALITRAVYMASGAAGYKSNYEGTEQVEIKINFGIFAIQNQIIVMPVRISYKEQHQVNLASTISRSEVSKVVMPVIISDQEESKVAAAIAIHSGGHTGFIVKKNYRRQAGIEAAAIISAME